MSAAGDTYDEKALLGGDLELSQSRELTDAGNADRLIDIHGEKLIFTPGIGWAVWDGKRWAPDETGELIRLARHVVATIQQQADEIEATRGSDDSAAKAFKKHAKATGQAHRLKAMIEVAQSDQRIVRTTDQLDSHPYALNTQSGIVDLRTGKLRAHNRAELHTMITRAGYEPEANAPIFRAFLKRITVNDADLEGFLRRLAGVALIGETVEHKVPILEGNGANGKSTFVRALARALGDYAHTAPPDLLMAGRRQSEGATPSVAGLRGRRLVTVSETAEDGKLAVERFKAISGGDEITGRMLNRNPITFEPTHTVWLQTNNRPGVPDTSEATWRRLLIVPFRAVIEEDEQDRQLEKKLRAEQDAIVAWAVAGCVEYLKGGLAPPDLVLEETQEYRETENAFKMWLSEHTTTAPEGEGEKATTILLAFNTWAHDNATPRLTPYSCAKRLAQAGFTRTKRSQANYWLGIRLLDSNTGQTRLENANGQDGEHGGVPQEIAYTRARLSQESENSSRSSTRPEATTVQLRGPATDEPDVLFDSMPDDELDQIARLTTQQIVDQEHRDQKKNGKPAEHPRDELPPIPAEAFAEHAKALPVVQDEESFTAEPVDWEAIAKAEADA